MGAKEKRQREYLEAIKKRKIEVIEAAKKVFAKKTIEKTTMKDIADQAEIGVASIYRYYSNKTALVIAVAIDYWQNDFNYSNIDLQGNGIEQTGQVLENIYKVIEKSPNLLVFMEQFDNFIIANGSDILKDYKKIFIEDIPQLKEVIEKGKEDGSIRSDVKSDNLAEIFINTIFIMAQKLYMRTALLKLNSPNEYQKQLELYKEMIITYLQSA